jgi:glycerol-3-phosphate dehydrogenase
VRTEADLGTHFGADLYAREVDYMLEHEWAASGEDILYRRTKAGLHLAPKQREALASYVALRAAAR